jgi:anti-anti-sigma regulatory factor
MIVGSKDNIVQVRGSLHRNEWLTIKALANILLQDHPHGIMIDCTQLTDVSENGSKTFLDAVRDIHREGSRMIVVNLPENVLQVVRSVPGVRSQLPLAKSLEEAQASLLLGTRANLTDNAAGARGTVLVPLLEGLDVEYAVEVAGRIAREHRLKVTFAALLSVSRGMPLMSPLPQEEGQANDRLSEAEAVARARGLAFALHIERVRDIEEGLLGLIKSSEAAYVVLSAYADDVQTGPFMDMVHLLLSRAPCNVIIARKAGDADHPLMAGGRGKFRDEE